MSSCSNALLKVRSEYLTPDDLASTRIETPDPWQQCYYGQQIVIHYRVPRAYFHNSTKIVLTMRYGNGCTETKVFSICSCRGYLIERLINDEYWDRGGVVSYKVELEDEGEVIETQTHHLWVEIIEM